jgi:hypothetical protein
MTIYDVTLKDMRKLFRTFHSSIYGRTIFFLAYFIPAMLFVSSVIIAIISLCVSSNYLLTIGTFLFLGFIPTFILGNIYFYSELRKFVEAGKFKK